tara:strand:- start:71 stop:247 length:177 start_codon:yes stop_codon:yes gene_type:complete
MTEDEIRKRRDKEIVDMIDVEQRTMTAVAKWLHISKQRVHQIYTREKEKLEDEFNRRV